MTTDNARLLVGLVLFIHALGHGGAVAALLSLEAFRGPSGGWRPARSWLFPSLGSSTAMTIAVGLWTCAMLGFALAAMSFWGVLLPVDIAGPAAAVAAAISVAGMLVFFGTWPLFNWISSFTMNVAVFAAQFVLGWPTQNPLMP